MTTPAGAAARLELWGGVECTVNRVGDRWFDQTIWSGHDRRPDDLARFHALGLRTLRYPVLWERVAPEGLAAADWRASDERLARLRELGIRPVAGLVHHGSGPRSTSLLDPAFPRQLAEYARAVAERYPWVEDYTPVNEPLTTARFAGLYGHWYPHGRSDRDYVRALLHQVRGVVLAMRAIREVVPHARLIQTDDCGRTFGTARTRAQVQHEEHRRWLTWDLLTGRVDERHPLYRFLQGAGMTAGDVSFFLEAACPPDVVGLNYYLTSDRYLDDRLNRYPPEVHGGNGRLQYADVEAVRGREDGIAGHQAHLLAAWRRYARPVAITEVHLGCSREEQLRWLMEAWRGAVAAREQGADVRAVTAWALLGSFNWNSLVTRDTGHYEPGAFDIRSPVPRPTAIARAITSLAAGEVSRHPVLHGAPWWRRAERLVSVRSSDADAPTGPPVLVVGAGTLGGAFAAICRQRGLRAVVAHRHHFDLAAPDSLTAFVDGLAPWAVVNAAGYVHVATAEREPEVCRRANVLLPEQLARACRRLGIPLLTFSSHMVFDGRAGRAYTEDDEPKPLNVYGLAKRDAERVVMELLPEALIVRTGTFFHGSDDRTYLACLLRAVDAGMRFPAPADAVVSPTYVPDLVHAALDLLIDGERGLWHVTNDGETTWFEFARRAAASLAAPASVVIPAAMADVWPGVVRPRHTSLASVRSRMLRGVDEALAEWARHASERRGRPSVDACA